MKRASLVLPLLLALPLLAVACGDGGTDEPTDAGSACGDGVCEGRETLNSCPEDCVECGDHECTVDNVPASAAASWAESIDSCQQDCGGTYVCGNLRCESATETAELCPYDCVTCGDGTCHRDYGESAINCDADCPPVCGDGACTKGESVSNCRRDCDAGGTCGDGVCNFAENKHTCIDDCADMCSEIGTAENLGQECGGNTGVDCGEWGVCVGSGDGKAYCRQVCWKNECEVGPCGTTYQCSSFGEENPPSDQHEGVYKGACTPAPNGAYEACGGAKGGCNIGLTCSGLNGVAGSAYCMLPCSTDANCGDYQGVLGSCLIQGEDTNYCTLTCIAGETGGCPAGMNCVDAGQTGLCMWPE